MLASPLLSQVLRSFTVVVGVVAHTVLPVAAVGEAVEAGGTVVIQTPTGLVEGIARELAMGKMETLAWEEGVVAALLTTTKVAEEAPAAVAW